MNTIQELLSDLPNSVDGRNKKVYNYSNDSASFSFYTNQFEGENDFEIGSAIKKEDLSESPLEMRQIMDDLKSLVSEDAVIVELGGSKFQRRSGFPYSFYKNYLPLDISLSSMIGYSELYDRYSIACDAQNLPFKDSAVDAVFTHTFLEHPIKPDEVVKEIDRILMKGGVVIHADAWHCRWWKRFGVYGVKSLSEMTLKDKLLNVVIHISEFKLFRFPVIVIKRFFKELFISKKRPQSLLFKKLIPNYELKIYSDEDAAGNIDPIDLIRFYESRGYELVNPKSFIKRLFFNDVYIVLKKKGN